jgi:hypothetical protein
MTIAVQGNRCSLGFHCAHLCPETGVRLGAIQVTVPVVGHDGQNGAQAKLFEQGKKPLPATARDGGAKIVEAKKILRRPGNHIASSDQVSYASV